VFIINSYQLEKQKSPKCAWRICSLIHTALFTTDVLCALPVAKSTLVTFCTRGVLVCGVFFQAVHANSLLSCGVRKLWRHKKSHLALPSVRTLKQKPRARVELSGLNLSLLTATTQLYIKNSLYCNYFQNNKWCK